VFLVEPATTLLLPVRGPAELRSIFTATVHIPAARLIHLRVGQAISEAVSPGHRAPSVAPLNGDCRNEFAAAMGAPSRSCTQSFDWRGTLRLKRKG
jgi:hypothetical protein